MNEKAKLTGILSLSFLQLSFEFLIMKLARYQFGTLSIGVVSVALLGVAAAALSISLFRTPGRAIRAVALSLPVLCWVCIAVQIYQGNGPNQFSLSNFLVSGTLAFIVLASCSIPLFAFIKGTVENVHRYYAASFIGGAIGIPVTLLLLELFGDLTTTSLLLLLTALPALTLLNKPGQRILGARLALLAFISSVPVFEHFDQRAHPASIYRESDALSRIDVEKDAVNPGALRFRQGGRGGMTRTSPLPVASSPNALYSDMNFIPWLLPAKRALVIGSGGGYELLGPLSAGVADIHAVEIDAKVIEYVNEHLPQDYNPYLDPRVHLYVSEGRDQAARLARQYGRTFDVVNVSTALLRAQSGQVFAQTHLVTEEALYQYLGMLSETGILSVSFPLPPEFRSRVTAAMYRALERHGVESPANHLRLILENNRKWLVMARPGGPFTDAETDTLLSPHPRAQLLDVKAEVAAQAGLQPFDDNYPFMFPNGFPELTRTSAPIVSVFDWSKQSVRPLLGGSVLLILLIFIAGIKSAKPGSRLPRIGYFACFTSIGFAYVVYQTLMLQRLSFLLGHPMLATAVILTTALLASGAGSWMSGRQLAENRSLMRAVGSAGLFCWILATALIRPEHMVIPSMQPFLLALCGVAIAVPPFLMMGTYFPATLHRIQKEGQDCIAWCWGLNGVAAIAGWTFMVAGSMSFGVRFVGITSAVVYGLVGVWEFSTNTRLLSETGRSAAHLVFALLILGGLTVAYGYS